MHFGKPQNDKIRLPEIVGLPMFPEENPYSRKNMVRPVLLFLKLRPIANMLSFQTD
jgi:hypothetical protein